MENEKVCLIVLDGWGHGDKDKKVNAIYAANTPYVDGLYKKYPNAELRTSGLDVGLPDGQMGNSEVGHLNIGAGRVVFQQLVRINKAFEEKTIRSNKTLNSALQYARDNRKKIHLIGLVSDGGIHSHIDHLKGLIEFFDLENFPSLYIHAFTDGRDTDPKSGVSFIEEMEEYLSTRTGEISSLTGRYFAMDRDYKWDRIKKAYEAMCRGEGDPMDSIIEGIKEAYQSNITDEFLPAMVSKKCLSTGRIEEGDVVINFNFRTDRGRQISRALSQEDFPEFEMKKLDIQYITMTEYDANYKNVSVLFPSLDIKNSLGEVLAKSSKSQVRIAETEKYPHVTFFFSGGIEKPFEQENRIMAQSPKVTTYDLAPEMSAKELSTKTCEEMQKNRPDYVLLNFANADMVGHTGVFSAIKKGVETVDSCCQEVVEKALSLGYHCLVTADHGNADKAVNPDGSPNTAHTTHVVPVFYVSNENKAVKIKNGRLADLAPTVLDIMGIAQPKEMTGRSLLVKD